MKAKYIFFLILLVTCAAKTNFFEIIKCLVTNPKIVNEVIKIVKLIMAKDFEGLLPAIIQAYFNIKDDVIDCFKEPVLTIDPLQACLDACGGDKQCQVACFYYQ